MRLSTRRSLGLAVFVLAIVPSPSQGLAARLPGQSATQLSDGRWLLLGGEGASASSLAIIGEQGEAPLRETLRQPRSHHTATVLPDGRVLVFGGADETGALVKRVEIFDASTLTFEPASNPPHIVRAGHTATLLMDGRVLIVGGLSPAGRPVSAVELWDPRTGRSDTLDDAMALPRWGHSAVLLPSGRLLISGGRDGAGAVVDTPELFVPPERRFAPLYEAAAASQLTIPELPEVAEMLPANDSVDVPLDATIAVRFSKPLGTSSLNVGSVTLLGPGGTTKTRVVAAERGSLLFVTPAVHFFPASDYTLFVDGAVDEQGNLLPFFAAGFRTRSLAGDETETDRERGAAPSLQPMGALPTVAGDAEAWVPGAAQLRGDWRANRPPSPLEKLPPLTATAGVTALAGQVLLLDGAAARDVTLQIGDRSVRSDGTGRFLLTNVPSGVGTLVIDGGTASRPGRTYGYFEALVVVVGGKTTALPYTIWLPRIDTRHAVNLPSPTSREVVVTSPDIPGLELRIPPGMVLRDRDGRVVNEVSITPIPVDRSPFPLPTRDVPVYFTIQPGGVHLQSLDPASPQGARLVYPNYYNRPPGALFDFWSYDPVDKGWYVYGQGKVGAGGQHVLPDPGVAIYEFTGAMVSLPSNAPPEGPPPGGCEALAADPVDCYTGLFLLSRTDLSLPGTIPISVTRTYRPRDTAVRAFGIGTNHIYDIFTVGDTSPWTYQDLILPDGGRIHFQRTSPGTGFVDAVYEHNSSPSAFQGAVISYVDGRWQLRMKSGVLMSFADCEGCASARAAALRQYRDRRGNTLTLERDSKLNLIRITSPDGRSISLAYDASNRVIEARDSAGRVVGYQYDGLGRLSKVTNPEGGVEEYSYDASHRMTAVKRPNGKVMATNVYDANGRVTKQTLADGGVYQFAYTFDGTGRVTRTDITDPRGNVRRLAFNTRGYVVSETLALGKPEQQTTTFERGAATNLLVSITDPLGRRTTFSYDARGNPTKATRLAGTAGAVAVTLTYDSSYSLLTSITDPLGHVVKFEYDGAGDLFDVKDALGNTTYFSHSTTGRLVGRADPMGQTMRFDYENGDLVAITDSVGRTLTFYSDAAGRLRSVTDPKGNLQRYDYDGLDRLARAIDPLGAVTSFAYDANGNVTQITDAKGGATRFTYDAKDRLTTMTDPLGHAESYAYDGTDNLIRHTQRNGKVSTFTYDALDRLKTAEFGRSSTASGLTSPDATVSYTLDAGSRVIQAADTQDGTITRTYDGLDRLLSETSPRGTVSYGYDAAGRRTTLSIPGQANVTYTYDDADRLTGIAQGTAQVGFTHDAVGRRTTLTLPGGIVGAYSYYAGELVGIRYTRSGVTIGDLAYVYDAAGRRIQESGSLARRTMPSPVASATYNAANRLTAWGGTPLTYDANGNLTSDGSRTFTWDSRNRLRAIGGAATASFAYDAFGRRSSLGVSSGSTTSFLYDGLNVVQELAGATLKATLLSGLGLDEVFQRTDSSGARSFLTDALGSTLVLADNAGASMTQYRYGPYGNTLLTGEASSNRFQYTGRENDGTGLYYYRARYYSPSLGRFVSEDPIGFEGGPNFYSYVAQNPVNDTDPYGLSPSFGDCLATCAADQLGLAALGTSLAVAGADIIPKPFVMPGSTPNTSLASKILGGWGPRGVFWGPTRRNLLSTTPVLGRAVARWLPIVGGGLLLYDSVRIGLCTKECMESSCEN